VSDKHRRVKKLEAKMPKPRDEEYFRDQIIYRLMLAIIGELGDAQAPSFVPGVVNGGPSYAEQEYGKAYTVRQLHELAIRRALDRLEEIARTPTGNSRGDLTPYLDPEDLTPEGRENLAQMFLESFRRHHEEEGGSWDDINRHERSRREAEAEANRRVQEEEWNVRYEPK
jgi:hypothetical protein